MRIRFANVGLHMTATKGIASWSHCILSKQWILKESQEVEVAKMEGCETRGAEVCGQVVYLIFWGSSVHR